MEATITRSTREELLRLADEAYVRAAFAQTNTERGIHLDTAAGYERRAELTEGGDRGCLNG